MTKTHQTQDKFEIGPFENGLDFIVSALEHLSGEPSERDIKYGVIHLSSGVELILKTRLLQEHWTLVFENPSAATKAKFDSGDFASVNFDTCIDRLINICQLQWLDNERKNLKSFRDKRNRIEHFGTSDSIEAITSSAAKTLSVILDFVTNDLSQEIVTEYEEELDNIRRFLGKFEKFVQHRLKRVKSDFSSSEIILECPRCRQICNIVSEGTHCRFCGNVNDDAEDAADEFVSEILGESQYSVVKDGGEWPIYVCHDCGLTSLVHLDTSFVCFNCAEHQNRDSISLCGMCSEPFHSSYGEKHLPRLCRG